MSTSEPTFQWTSVAGASYYEVSVTDTLHNMTLLAPTHVNASNAPTIAFTPSTPLPALPAGDSYQWFVFAYDDEGDFTIQTGSTIYNVVILLGSPAIASYAGAAAGITPRLSWQPVPGAVAYHLSLVDETSGTTVLANAAVASTAYPVTTPLSYGHDFQWYVTAQDASGNVSFPSKVDQFVSTTPRPTRLAIIGEPAAYVGPGSPFSLTVAVEDAAGNTFAGYSGSISLTLARGPGGAHLGGVFMATVSNGMATFTGLTLDRVGSAYELQASAGGLTPATTTGVTVSTAPVGFDEAYYLAEYPDVARAVALGQIASGYQHYLLYGQHEGRNPSAFFDEKYYLATNPDVAAAVRSGQIASGFQHFLAYGQFEGRDPSPFFSTSFYLARNPDVASVVGPTFSAFQHYLLFGQHEGRDPSPAFDEQYYLAANPDVAAAVASGALTSGYEHFIESGQFEGRAPSAFYNESYYLSAYPDVAAAVRSGQFTSGYEHFVEAGLFEGRIPLPGWNDAAYLAANPDVAAVITSKKPGAPASGFEHYLLYGRFEGRVSGQVVGLGI